MNTASITHRAPIALPSSPCVETRATQKPATAASQAPVDTFEIKANAAALPPTVAAAKREVIALAKANTTNLDNIKRGPGRDGTSLEDSR